MSDKSSKSVVATGDISVDKNVPIPASLPVGRRPMGCKYPIRELDVGDSFLIREKELNVDAAMQRVKSALRHWGGSFPDRKHVAGLEEAGVRIWRVK